MNKVRLLLLLSLIITKQAFCLDHFDIINLVDTSYLPYKSVEVHKYDIRELKTFPIKSPIKVIKTYQPGTKNGVIIKAYNKGPTNANNSLFSEISYPSFDLIDDDPIRHTITNWTTWVDEELNQYVFGICHQNNNLNFFKINTLDDIVEYKELYQASDESKIAIPYVNIYYVGDYNKDNKNEIIFYIQHGRLFRTLYSIDINSLDINWELSIASGLGNNSVYPTNKNEILLITICPYNGMSDSNFSDLYSYISLIDSSGCLISNKVIGYYGSNYPVLSKANDTLYYLFHTLPFQYPKSIDTSQAQQYLSVLDPKGNPLSSITFNDINNTIWPVTVKNTRIPSVFVLDRNKNIRVYDYRLDLIKEFSYQLSWFNYLGRTLIKGKSDSVYVFNDGLYDINFNKIMQFPFLTSDFQVASKDSLGNTVSYVINKDDVSYTGKIVTKSKFELLSVFYHNNQNYILMLLSSLLVGLVSIFIYNRKTKNNLNLIALQKSEIEQTHKELIDTQQKLIEAEKYKQAKDIAGGFAHEIRNALFPAETLLTKIRFKSNIENNILTNYYTETHNSIVKAIDLTRMISDYTKLDSEYNPEEVNLLKVVNKSLSNFKVLIEDNNIKLIMDIDGSINLILNKDQLEMVMNNLLSNSIDALLGINNPSITIIAKKSDNLILLSVKDNGCGIKDDNISKVFDTFYSTKPDKGTGLGLATVKKIINLYNGSISVTSNLGDGTIFTMSWET